ncbi:hypothetical protein Tco_0323354 [Tanacetum coccineum]
MDEYGFVIRQDSVALTSGSVGPFTLQIYTCDQGRFNLEKNLLDGFQLKVRSLSVCIRFSYYLVLNMESSKSRTTRYGEDLEVLYKIVKDRFKSTKPVGDNIVLWGNLMTMFEPSAGDEMWREQGRYLIKSWKLIDSCGVHCLMLESMYIYMLVEKEYPLAQFAYRRMWEGKLQVDYECEMAFELLRFIKK